VRGGWALSPSTNPRPVGGGGLSLHGSPRRELEAPSFANLGRPYRRLREQKRFHGLLRSELPDAGSERLHVQGVSSSIFSDRHGDGGNAPGLLAPSSARWFRVFDKGAVILGITSAAYQQQEIPAQATVAPSPTAGRRDLLSPVLPVHRRRADSHRTAKTLAPTLGAKANNTASIIADALTGDGTHDEFPRDLIVPPSTGIAVRVQSLVPAFNFERDCGALLCSCTWCFTVWCRRERRHEHG